AAKPWTPPTRLRNLLGDHGSPGPSGKHRSSLSWDVRSPLQSAVASTSPGSMEPRLLSTPRTISSWNCMSIATPETGSRRRTTLSTSPEGQGDSEMELALELVNHVRPEVADRLLQRLRGAETARQLAEERFQRARSQEGRWCRCGRIVDVALVLTLLVLLAVQVADAVSQLGPKEQPAQPPQAPTRQESPPALFSRVPAHELQEENVSDSNVTCEAFLQEALLQTEQLKRRHERLQVGFAGALQAASQWVGFLQRAAANASHGNLAECREAAKPGQAAIEALLAEVGPEESQSSDPSGEGF
ncbi:unnamed protein product, partial [Symbiodinium sp. CCMP2592]